MLISNGLRLIFFCLLFLAQPISFHQSRHTFATTVTLANHVSMESVSKMLGHSSILMTKIYARILDSSVEREMDELENILKFDIDN